MHALSPRMGAMLCAWVQHGRLPILRGMQTITRNLKLRTWLACGLMSLLAACGSVPPAPDSTAGSSSRAAYSETGCSTGSSTLNGSLALAPYTELLEA